MLDHVPYQVQVDTPVAVDKPVAECDDPGPGYGAVLPLGGGQTAGGLADDLEIPHHRVLDQPFAQKRLATAGDIGVDCGDGVGDVRQVGTIGFHSGVASASM